MPACVLAYIWKQKCCLTCNKGGMASCKHTYIRTYVRFVFFFFFFFNSIITTNIMWLQKLRSHNTDAVPVSSVENKAHLVQHVTSRRKVYDNGWEDGGRCAGKRTY